MNSTMNEKLPFAVTLPSGETADDVVIGLISQKLRRELSEKYKGRSDLLTLHTLQKRILRLGSLDAPIPAEVLEDLPTPSYDYLIEAIIAMDSGYESVGAFRDSEEYKRMG